MVSRSPAQPYHRPESDEQPVGQPDAAARPLSRLGWYAVVLFAGVAFAACYWDMSYHPTPQYQRTTHHLAAAQSLLQGQGLKNNRNRHYARTPPLYPILLAELHLTGLSWWSSVCLINSLFLACGILAVYSLCTSLGLRRSSYVLLFYLAFTPHHNLLHQARPDWAFCACSLAAVAFTAAYLRRPGTTSLIGLALACALAALTRYLALFTLFPVIATAILLARGYPLRRKARHFMLFLCIACVPIGAWLVRNVVVREHISGMDRTHLRASQDPAMSTFGANTGFLPKTFYVDLFCWPTLASRSAVNGEKPLEYQVLTLGILSAGFVVLLGWTIANLSAVHQSVSTNLLGNARPRSALLVIAAYFLM